MDPLSQEVASRKCTAAGCGAIVQRGRALAPILLLMP